MSPACCSTSVGPLYLAWIDDEAPDEFLIERTLEFLRAFLGVPVEMLELSKDLSRPTHFEQLGITTDPKLTTRPR